MHQRWDDVSSLVQEGEEYVLDYVFDFCPYCGRSFKEEPPRTKKEIEAQRKDENEGAEA